MERRARSPIAHAAHCLYEQERRTFGRHGPLIGHDLVRRIIARFGGRSVLSGRVDKLRLRRFWPELPFSEENAIVITASENRSLAHCATLPLKRFPRAFVERMLRLKEQAEHPKA